MKQLEVTIMGQSYILGCPEGGELSLMEAVAHVDREMSAIRDAGRVKSRERIAVLAALNLAFSLAEQPAKTEPDKVEATPSEASSIEANHIDVDRLIRKLDQALGADGQLL